MSSVFESLVERQQIFVTEYLASMDRMKAVKEAGYKGNNNVLSVRAKKLLNDPKIQAAMAEIGNPILDGNMLTIDNLSRQLARFIFRDLTPFIDDAGYLKVPLDKLPPDITQCIEGWDIERRILKCDDGVEEIEEKVKVRLVSKIKATELAMRWKNMLQPNTTNINVQNNNFDWKSFFDNPPPVVETRLIEALNDSEKEQRKAT